MDWTLSLETLSWLLLTPFLTLGAVSPDVFSIHVKLIVYLRSTPFLNVHWCLDKLGKTGSTLQYINGIILLSTFFGVRICYGWYMVCFTRVTRVIFFGVLLVTMTPIYRVMVSCTRYGKSRIRSHLLSRTPCSPETLYWTRWTYSGTSKCLKQI